MKSQSGIYRSVVTTMVPYIIPSFILSFVHFLRHAVASNRRWVCWKRPVPRAFIVKIFMKALSLRKTDILLPSSLPRGLALRFRKIRSSKNSGGSPKLPISLILKSSSYIMKSSYEKHTLEYDLFDNACLTMIVLIASSNNGTCIFTTIFTR